MTAQIKYVKVEDLTAAKFNPASRTEERRLKHLRRSMEEHGFLDAFPIIVDKDNVVADGHRRLATAMSLGIEKVPVLQANSGLSADQYWSLNSISESPTATEVLEAYTKGMSSIPEKHRNSILLIQEVLGGKRKLKELFETRSFTPAIYRLSKRIAKHCGREQDNAFVAQTIVWIVKNKSQKSAYWAMSEGVEPDVLITAIENYRKLSIVANIA